MKRKFLAVLLAAAMIATQMASIVAIASTEEVTKTYFDINFENWTNWGDNKFNYGNNSDGSAISHEWGANPWQMTSFAAPDRAGKVMKATIPTSGGSNYLFRSRMRATNHPSDYTNVDVLWNEFSIKYEGGFVGFGTNENDSGNSIISVNKNGQLALGAHCGYDEVGGSNFSAGTIIPGVQLELGKWYHIAVAADFTAENASSGVPTYVWVNGEKVSEGITIPSIVPGANWVYNKLWFDQAESTESIAYIDNVKVYETAILDEHAESDFDITVAFDPSLEISEDQVTIPANVTVAQVKELIAADGCSFAFVKDGAALGDGDNAAGATLYVNAANGIGYKCYSLIASEEEIPQEPEIPDNIAEVTKTYFDIGFENWTNWGDNKFNGGNNSDGSAISHEWGANPWQMTSFDAPDRAGKVMKATIPTSGGSNYLFRSRMRATNHPSDYTNVDVLWNEFSIKYENGFVGFGTNENDSAYSIISINKNGQLALGARWAYNEVGGGNFEAGTIVPGVQLELGKWYHIAVAADFTDANASSGVPTYVWVNGEKVSEGITIPSIVPGANWAYNKLYFDQAESTESIVYFDNVKVFETATLDSHAAKAFDISVTFGSPIEVSEDQVTVPANATVAQVKELITAEGCTLSFVKGGAALGDSGTAAGATLYVNSADSIGYKRYTLLAGDITIPDQPAVKIEDYIDINFDNWTENNSNLTSDGSSIKVEWGACTWGLSPVEDAERGGKVLRANVATTSDGSPYYVRARIKQDELPSSYEECKVLWNEFSIKYEGGFAGFGFGENDGAYSLISINKDGQLEIGTQWGYGEIGGTNFARGTTVPNGQLAVGRWCDIAVAMDFANATNAGTPTYILVNGDLIADGIINPNVKPGDNWKYHKLWFDVAASDGTVAYIDDLKVYETDILQIDVPEKSNVMTGALNSITANIRARDEQYLATTMMADGIKSDDNMYKSFKTTAEQDGLKVVAALNGVYKISSVTVSERWMGDQGLTVTVEIGKNGNLTKVVDNQPVNKGSEGGVAVETTYSFIAAEGDTIVYTFKAATHRPEESDYQIYELEAMGSYVGDVEKTALVPEVGFWYNDWNGETSTNINSYYINCNNASGEEISGKLFIAAYKNKELVKLIDAKDVTLKKGANTISCEKTSGIYDSTWTYKAFLWEDLDTATPIVASVDVIK